MKIIRIIVFTILIAVGFLIVGEINLLNLWSFQDQHYSADFYIPEEKSNADARKHVDDFINAARETSVDFFAVEYQWDTDYENTTIITGTSGAISKLKQSGISEGANSSLLFPAEQVKFTDVDFVNDFSNVNTLYFIGSEKDYDSICEFKAKLVDQYGGGFPHEKGSSLPVYFELIALWGLIYFCNILLSWYEAKSSRKENMIKAIMGRNISANFFKGLILETVAFVLVFMAAEHFLSNVSRVDFKEEISILLFIIYVVLNGVIGSWSIKSNYRKALFDDEEDQRMLKINYAGKCILAVVVIVAMSVNVMIAFNAYQIDIQRDFFNQHKDYSYYKLGYSLDAENTDDGELPEEKMYRAFYERFQNNALQYLDMTGYYNVTYPFVTLNRNAFLQACSKYPQLRRVKADVLNGKISLLFPAGMSETSRDYENALEMNDGIYYSEQEYGSWKKLKYEPGVNVEAVHEDGNIYQMHQYKDPVILVNNIEYSADSTSGYDDYNSYDIMYSIPQEQFRDFADEYGLEESYISITGVNDEFEYIWNQETRKLKVTVFLLAVLLILEILISALIISMEYRINAIEMALMKTLGYSLKDRNIKIIRATVAAYLIGLAIAAVASMLLRLEVPLLILLIMTLALMAFEIALIVIKASDVERKRVITILKGETV